MKKNKAMRLASALLVLTLLTTCAISSTFAKYVTEAKGSDSARVAKWGFTQAATIELGDLFKNVYTNDNNDKTVKSTADVIAPGTMGEATFGFTYGGATGITAPEVAYTFKIDTTDSSCAQAIQDNHNIQWKLDNGDWGTWDQMITAIEALDGNKAENEYYAPNTLPEAFYTAGANTHTVSWQWVFNTTDEADVADTAMGNATDLANVTLKITVTATQVD